MLQRRTSTPRRRAEPTTSPATSPCAGSADAVDAPDDRRVLEVGAVLRQLLDGYKLGDDAAASAEATPARRRPARRSLRRTPALDRDGARPRSSQVESGNARLRQLAADDRRSGWWQLLWVPPSLPYLEPGRPVSPSSSDRRHDQATRVLVLGRRRPPRSRRCSATRPKRRIAGSDRGPRTTPDGSTPTGSQYRLDERPTGSDDARSRCSGRSPALAAAARPARRSRGAAPDAASTRGRDRARPISGELGQACPTAPPAGDRSRRPGTGRAASAGRSSLPTAVARPDAIGDRAARPRTTTTERRVRPGSTRTSCEASQRRRHGAADRPRHADLADAVAALGAAAPGNIAWRALRRLLDRGAPSPTPGTGARRRPSPRASEPCSTGPRRSLLLDQLDAATRTYWRAVLALLRRRQPAGGARRVPPPPPQRRRASSPRRRRLCRPRRRRRRARSSLRPVDLPRVRPAATRTHRSPSAPLRAALRRPARRTQEDARQPEVRGAFNSPFWPFVLATTSVGQEGIDFHWWCHAVVHWNTPANPVDFEQREGRVAPLQRPRHPPQRRRTGTAPPFSPCRRRPLEYRLPTGERRGRPLGEFAPYWVYPGPARIERHVAPVSAQRRQRPGYERIKAGRRALPPHLRPASPGGHARTSPPQRHRRPPRPGRGDAPGPDPAGVTRPAACRGAAVVDAVTPGGRRRAAWLAVRAPRAVTSDHGNPGVTGVVTALVGFSSSFVVVLAGLTAVGATPRQAASGLLAVCGLSALGTLWLSGRHRTPISLAWSTPGAALLASTGAVAGGWPAAVGAFMVTGALIVATGLVPRLGELIAAGAVDSAAVWTRGDYPAVAELFEPAAVELVRAVGARGPRPPGGPGPLAGGRAGADRRLRPGRAARRRRLHRPGALPARPAAPARGVTRTGRGGSSKVATLLPSW